MQGFDPGNAGDKDMLMNRSIVVEDKDDAEGDVKKPAENLLGDIDEDEGPNTTRERSGTLAMDTAADLLGGGSQPEQIQPRRGSGENINPGGGDSAF